MKVQQTSTWRIIDAKTSSPEEMFATDYRSQECFLLLSDNPGNGEEQRESNRRRGTKAKYRQRSNFPSGSTNQPKCLNSLSNNTLGKMQKFRGRKHVM